MPRVDTYGTLKYGPLKWVFSVKIQKDKSVMFIYEKKSNIVKLEPENSRGLCYLQSLQVEIWTWLLQTRFFDQGNNA